MRHGSRAFRVLPRSRPLPWEVSDDRPTRCATPPEVSGRRCMDQCEVRSGAPGDPVAPALNLLVASWLQTGWDVQKAITS